MKFFAGLGAVCNLAGHFIADFFRLVRGVWKLSSLQPPIISVFGGSKVSQEHDYSKKARQLSEKLIAHNISVVTGGGPGIMEAVNCAATHNNEGRSAKSIGITVHGLDAEQKNTCADSFITTHYFFARKWLLTRYSNAFAIFPGGYGTLDELFEILTLIQTKKLKRVPIVLIEKSYWTHLIDWVKKAQQEGLLDEQDARLIFITDDIEEAFQKLSESCQTVKQ